MRTKQLNWRAVLALAALASALGVLVWTAFDRAQTIEVVVPAGTQQRIEAGEEVELLPALLEVSVGDSIIIINNDASTHIVGPYIVGPGQRIEQRFSMPGEISGICTLHPSGRVSIVVR